MRGSISSAQFITMTASWCLCAAYRLAAAAHTQKQLLDEAQLSEIEAVAIEHGRAASQAQAHVLVGADKRAATEQGVQVAIDLFAKFRQQRQQ